MIRACATFVLICVTGPACGEAGTDPVETDLPDETDIPLGEDEPQPGAASVIVFEDDFESYDGGCWSLIPFGGGPWATNRGTHCTDDPNNIISTPDGEGYVGSPTATGGRVVRWNWPESTSEQHYILGKSVDFPGAGVPEYFSFYYRTSVGFVYRTKSPRVGKKHFLIWPDGGLGRWTNGTKGWSLLQSNGEKIDSDWDVFPDGLTADQYEQQYINDGRWHHYTYERTPESVTGALDGRVRVWMDGLLVLDRQNLGTFAQAAGQITLAGTFNGGSSKNQQEYFDNFVSWYNP